MRELIAKVEARIEERQIELEVWTHSHTANEMLRSEIAFLEALLAEMKEKIHLA